MMNERHPAFNSSFRIPHSSFHCGGHGMTFPCSGVGEGAGAAGCEDERAGCVSVVCELRPEVAARELSSAFGSLRFSLVGADAASRVLASVLFFERAASSVAGMPFSERTVGSLGAFAWPAGGT